MSRHQHLTAEAVVLGLLIVMAPGYSVAGQGSNSSTTQQPIEPPAGNARKNQAQPQQEPSKQSQPQPDIRSESLKSADWLQVLINFALLLAIIVQAYIYHRQRQVMERQLTAMQESLEETRKIVQQNDRVVQAAELQAHAAETTAEAARESSAIAKEAFETVERAYIVISDMGSQGFGQDGAVPAVIVQFANTGRSAAHSLASFVELAAGSEPPSISLWQPIQASRKVSRGFIPPFGISRVVHPQPDFRLTEEQSAALRDNNLRLFALVQADYIDIRGKHHSIRFRGEYDWYSSRFKLDGL